MSKIILGFTGLMASGKDVSKKYLEERYGAKSFKFSTVMRELLQRLGLEIKRSNLVSISYSLRQTFGEDLFSKVMAKDVNAAPEEIIVVDGIRRLTDIQYLKDLPGFYLISIEADPKIRYDRAVARNENVGDAEKTFEQFLLDHQQMETEASIPSVMEKAEITVNNNGTLDELYAQIDKIITAIKKSS
jgi:dephospho-CoA kinase